MTDRSQDWMDDMDPAERQRMQDELLAVQPDWRWQPIETAPKDGTRILVWSPIWNGCVTVAVWTKDELARKQPRPFWQLENDLRVITYSRSNQPTHWMPLPEPPKE